MAGDRQHYIPAALIGGFGRPAADGRLRHATVAVRLQATGAVLPRFRKAETVGYEKRIYRLKKQLPGVDPDVIDNIWKGIEQEIPALVERLDARQVAPGDDETLLAYAATASVRHPTFARVADDWQKRHGQPLPVGDDVNVMRVQALANQFPAVRSWRWRVLHSPPGDRRFMISDRGWSLVGDAVLTILLPMGPRVAILGYPDDPALPPRRPPFEEHLDVVDSWIGWFNAATWADHEFTNLLIAHPDDLALLEQLPDHNDLRVNQHGPYMGRNAWGLCD